MTNYGAKQYKQTSITTASKGQLLILLYEAAIRHVKKASECIDKNDIAGKGTAIGKVHDIMNELITSLDHKVGGKVAEDLERLYNFCIDQLLQANMKNSKESLQSVEKTLSTLLTGWREAVKKVDLLCRRKRK